MKPRTETWWCVKETRGYLLAWTCTTRKKYCTEKFTRNWKPWKEFYKKGYRCVKIEVKEK